VFPKLLLLLLLLLFPLFSLSFLVEKKTHFQILSKLVKQRYITREGKTRR